MTAKVQHRIKNAIIRNHIISNPGAKVVIKKQ